MLDMMNPETVKKMVEIQKKEIDYFKGLVKEYEAVVKQLSGQKGEYTYIHPFDMYEIMNDPDCDYVYTIFEKDFHPETGQQVIHCNGKKYIQTTCIPARNKQLS